MKKTLLIASIIALGSVTGLVACSDSNETSTAAPAPVEQAATPVVEASKTESVKAQAVEKVEAVKEQAAEKITEVKEQAAAKIEETKESALESVQENSEDSLKESAIEKLNDLKDKY